MIARYVGIGLLACFVSLSAHAQRSLESLVTEAGAEWMFGKWEAASDNGDSVTLTVSWDLDKHVAILHVKTPDMESKGYTVKDPKSEEIKYVSFDNRGSVGKGSWAMEGGDLVLRVESESADRGPWKAGFIFGGSASEGLQVSMHNVDSSGDLEKPARRSFKFKKQK
jgi:hypothetical protein